MKSILGRKVTWLILLMVWNNLCQQIEVLPNVVLQKKTIENDGYEAVQVDMKILEQI